MLLYRIRSMVLLSVAAVIALVAVSCSRGENGSDAVKNLPALEFVDSDDSDWAVLDDGSRRLVTGATGLLEAPAWWDGNRTSRGDMVVLELEYRDELETPARVEVYSGLGRADRLSGSELHRFGGLNDSAWKTARIPCPWDFLLAYEDSSGARSAVFMVEAGKGALNVRSARLTGPRPGDEEDWNRETREWVARVQGHVRADSAYWGLAREPVLDGAVADAPLVVYHRSWMDMIQPVSAPREGETAFPARARMALNEYEPLQLGVYANGRGLEDVRVSAGPLVDSDGEAMVDVTVRVAEYPLVRSAVEGLEYQPFPQRLWPAFAFDLPQGRSRMVWLVLETVDGRTEPGTWTTEVRFTARGLDEVTVPVEVEVLPVRLLTMDEAGLTLAGCTIGLPPEHELEFLQRYNHNSVNLWYFSARPGLYKRGDSFGIDWRIMDDWMDSARRTGHDYIVWFLGENPYGFPRTMSLERSLAKAALGVDDRGYARMQMEKPDSVLPEVAPLYVEWCRRLREHARANDWPVLNLTPFDEPAKWVQNKEPLGDLWFIKPHFIHSTELIREGFPEAIVSGDIHHYEGGIDFLPYLDVFCTNAVHENWDMPGMVREAGKTLWEYSGTGDKGEPARARYTFGFYFAAHDSRGSLVWAYNWGARFNTLEGSNWLYAWNTPFDVIPHPYMEGLREAWDERRLIESIRAAAGAKGVDAEGFLEGIFEEVARNRGRGGTSTVTDFWQQAEDESRMDLWHRMMQDKLVELAGE